MTFIEMIEPKMMKIKEKLKKKDTFSQTNLYKNLHVIQIIRKFILRDKMIYVELIVYLPCCSFYCSAT